MKQETAALLTAHGLRPTQQRIAVYEHLLEYPEHPSAETVYLALSRLYPAFSKTTVYNSLHALAEAGLVRTLTIQAEELRFDGTAVPHGHIQCSHCGAVADIPLAGFVPEALCPAGYELQRSEVFLYGICPHCRQSGLTSN